MASKKISNKIAILQHLKQGALKTSMSNSMIYLVNKKCGLFLFIFFSWSVIAFAQPLQNRPVREHIRIDDDWRFAFGHPYDTKKISITALRTFPILQNLLMAMEQLRPVLMIAPGAN